MDGWTVNGLLGYGWMDKCTNIYNVVESYLTLVQLSQL